MPMIIDREYPFALQSSRLTLGYNALILMRIAKGILAAIEMKDFMRVCVACALGAFGEIAFDIAMPVARGDAHLKSCDFIGSRHGSKPLERLSLD